VLSQEENSNPSFSFHPKSKGTGLKVLFFIRSFQLSTTIHSSAEGPSGEYFLKSYCSFFIISQQKTVALT
jgi:hypothetical protein